MEDSFTLYTGENRPARSLLATATQNPQALAEIAKWRVGKDRDARVKKAWAKAMLAVDDNDYDRALKIVNKTRDQIGSWPAVEAEEFFVERERSETALEELEQELLQKRPLSPVEQLQRSLEEAIDSEEFERAAVLRDEIKKLQEEES